jgi:glutamate racemase
VESSASPIGVFDSGVGGLTVVRALRALLPAEDILYLGDTARVPYGAKSPKTVQRYSLACGRFLASHGIKMMVVACNTASAHALPALETAFGIPVLGAILPGARVAHAASASGHIGVIGTLGTIGSGAYARALRELHHGAKITGQACPLLVPLAEEGWIDDEIALLIATRYLGELSVHDTNIDTLVLGCTHYPLLAGVLSQAAQRTFPRPVTLVDSATAMAHAAHDTLLARGELRDQTSGRRGLLRCFMTDTSRFEELAPRFLGEPISTFATVDLT